MAGHKPIILEEVGAGPRKLSERPIYVSDSHSAHFRPIVVPDDFLSHTNLVVATNRGVRPTILAFFRGGWSIENLLPTA